MAIRQAIVIVIISGIIALLVNLGSPNKIPLVGDYPELQGDDKPVVPPDSEPGDPSFIAVGLAELDHMDSMTIFIDSREEAEFNCGTIPGSISIPFDYLPMGDDETLAIYFDSCLNNAELDRRIITFCSGEECDLSLHLARNLQYLGYTNVAIFFGGAREWENRGKEVERREQCGD